MYFGETIVEDLQPLITRAIEEKLVSQQMDGAFGEHDLAVSREVRVCEVCREQRMGFADRGIQEQRRLPADEQPPSREIPGPLMINPELVIADFLKVSVSIEDGERLPLLEDTDRCLVAGSRRKDRVLVLKIDNFFQGI